jgi:hypothetical protein
MAPSLPFDWPGGSWDATLLLALVILGAIGLIAWTIALIWTFLDIRQRTPNPAAQIFSMLLVAALFLPGLWFYRMLRPRYLLTDRFERRLIEEALLRDLDESPSCPRCETRVRDEFLFCPRCYLALKEPCEFCTKPLAPAWGMCPYCGLRKAKPAAVVVTGTETAVEAPVPTEIPVAVPAASAAIVAEETPAPKRPTRDPFGAPTPAARLVGQRAPTLQHSDDSLAAAADAPAG